MTGSAISTRVCVLAALLAMVPNGARAADNQIRGFLGSTFSGYTTFVDPELAAGKPNVVIGASAVTLGDMFGGEVEVCDAPGFFQSGDTHLVLSSRVTTVTGNVVIAAPRHLMEYTLRPYFVAGGGLMRVRKQDALDVFSISRILPAFDIGVGAMGFVSNRVGVAWEVRRFQNLHRQTDDEGQTTGGEKLSFWRATMAFVYRY